MSERDLSVLLSEENKKRLDTIKSRANKLGVLDISFSEPHADDFSCLESVLDVIEEQRGAISDKAREKMEKILGLYCA